jgi:hypothetical protein
VRAARGGSQRLVARVEEHHGGFRMGDEAARSVDDECIPRQPFRGTRDRFRSELEVQFGHGLHATPVGMFRAEDLHMWRQSVPKERLAECRFAAEGTGCEPLGGFALPDPVEGDARYENRLVPIRVDALHLHDLRMSPQQPPILSILLLRAQEAGGPRNAARQDDAIDERLQA